MMLKWEPIMADSKHIPERTCVGCFNKKPQADLLAITKLKNGEIVVNIYKTGTKTASGRSVYLCFNPACLKIAKTRKGKNGLEFGLKTKIPENIWVDVEKEIFNS